MEKNEATREWCVEKALLVLLSDKVRVSLTVQDVVNTARELEAYITDTMVV